MILQLFESTDAHVSKNETWGTRRVAWATRLLEEYEMRSTAASAILSIILLTLAVASVNTSPVVRVSIVRVERGRCTEPSNVKVTVSVRLRNMSKAPLHIGRLAIAQDRFYKKYGQGKLQLIASTDSPDEFVPSSAKDNLAEIKELPISPHESKTFTLEHYVYFDSTALQAEHTELIASFHITNVQKGGDVSSYWSEPISIPIPQDCKSD